MGKAYISVPANRAVLVNSVCLQFNFHAFGGFSVVF